MIKILASGDHHFSEHSRFAECKRVHQWMVEEVRRRKPAAFLSGGDIYESASTPLERAAVAEWLTAIAEVCPIVLSRGNHDRPFELGLLRRLRTKHPIIVEERCGVHYVGGAAIAVLAWPERATLLAQLGSAADADMAAGDALRAVLRGLGAELAAYDGPKVLLTHCMLDGSKTSLGQPLIGASMNVGLADLALSNADFVIASHVHMPQEYYYGNTQFLYAGSPFRTAFGEVEQKSIVELTLGNEGTALWERIPTPATPMLLGEDEWRDGEWLCGWTGLDPDQASGAEIRLRWRVPSDQREEARRAVMQVRDDLLSRSAVSVKLDEVVIAVTRARAPQISAAKTLREKLDVLWTARNDVPDAARRERLLSKLAQVEQEVA